MNRLYTYFIAFLLLGTVSAAIQGTLIDATIARLDGIQGTLRYTFMEAKSDFLSYVNTSLHGQMPDKATRIAILKALIKNKINGLVEEEILNNYVTCSDKELTQIKRQLASNLGLNEKQFDDFVMNSENRLQVAQILGKFVELKRINDFDHELRKRIMTERFNAFILNNTLKPTAAELLQIYNDNIASYTIPQKVETFYIYLAQTEANATLAQKILQKLLETPQAFSALAKQYSIDKKSAGNNGFLNNYTDQQLKNLLQLSQDDSLNIEENQIYNQVLVYPNRGFAIFKFGKITAEQQVPFERVEQSIHQEELNARARIKLETLRQAVIDDILAHPYTLKIYSLEKYVDLLSERVAGNGDYQGYRDIPDSEMSYAQYKEFQESR